MLTSGNKSVPRKTVPKKTPTRTPTKAPTRTPTPSTSRASELGRQTGSRAGRSITSVITSGLSARSRKGKDRGNVQQASRPLGIKSPGTSGPASRSSGIPSSVNQPGRPDTSAVGGSTGTQRGYRPPPTASMEGIGGMPTAPFSPAAPVGDVGEARQRAMNAIRMLAGGGFGGGGIPGMMAALPQRNPLDYINDLLSAVSAYGTTGPGSAPDMFEMAYNMYGSDQPPMGAGQSQMPMQQAGPSVPNSMPPNPNAIRPQQYGLEFGPARPPVVPGVGEVNPAAMTAQADRLTGMAQYYGVAPGLTPEQTALNIPWRLAGFSDHNQGADWANQYYADTGMWPWEGPGSEEENLGRALGSAYSIGAGYDPYDYGPYQGEWTDYYNQYPLPAYQPYQDYGWYGGGGGGGGWGNYSYAPYENPWYYSDQQSGV